MATTRRQRFTRRLALVVRWTAGSLLIALLVSWALSRTHRHGVILDGFRRYAISSFNGAIELRYATQTDPDFSTKPTSLKQRPFAPPDRRFVVTWFGPAGPPSTPRQSSGMGIPNWPVVVVERSLWPQSAESFSGGEFPKIESESPNGTITVAYVRFGERTRLTFVPYWIPVAAAAEAAPTRELSDGDTPAPQKS